MKIEEAKIRTCKYFGKSWDIFVWACRVSGSDPFFDAFHEAYEQKTLEKITHGEISTMEQLFQHPRADFLLAVAHAMACLLTANQFGSPKCPDPTGISPKCKYCCITPEARNRH